MGIKEIGRWDGTGIDKHLLFYVFSFFCSALKDGYEYMIPVLVKESELIAAFVSKGGEAPVYCQVFLFPY